MLNYAMAAVFSFTGPTVVGLRLTVALLGIAGVAACYAWARPWYGPRVALIAAALMAGSAWHIFLSRFGVRAILLPIFEPLLCLALWHAITRRSWTAFLALGLLGGLSAYTYLPIRLFPAVLVVCAAVALRRTGGVDRHAAASFAAAGAIALLVVAPLTVHFIQNPADLNQRVGQVSLLSGRDAAWDVTVSTLRTLGMFTWRGDEFPFTNVPGRPVFDPLLSVFTLLGLAVCIIRARRGPYLVLLIWLTIMVIPGVLTVGAPNSQRTAGLMPAIYLLPALGISTATAWLIRRARGRAAGLVPIARLLPAIAIAVGSALAVKAYFWDLTLEPRIMEWYETEVVALAHHARALPPDTPVFGVFGDLPDVARNELTHNTLDFVSGRRIPAYGPELIPLPAARGKPAIYLSTAGFEVPWESILQGVQRTTVPDPVGGRLAFMIQGAAPPESAVPLARWSNGLTLRRATLGQTTDGKNALVLVFDPADRPINGRLHVSIVDATGRERDLTRYSMRGAHCPPGQCPGVAALARIATVPSLARSAPPPYTARLSFVAEDGATVDAIDDHGQRVDQWLRALQWGT
ncbi:MAG: glycosyltransferase family 39 protein [Chloroflexota bacterium]